MERNEITIEKVLELKKAHEITDKMIKNLWYDWFCKDKALVNRGRKLLYALSRLAKVNNNKFDPKKTYVFFKNNCPISGNLYDDFRICDIETGDVIWTIIPSSDSGAELWGKVNDFDKPILEEAEWKDIVEYFKN